MPSESLSQSEYIQTLAFDYERLEKNIIEEFILGKPMINDDLDSLRIPFKYRKSTAVAIGVGVSEADIDALSKFLGDEFKVLMHISVYSTNAYYPSYLNHCNYILPC